MKVKLTELFGADLRSLGAMRIAVGLILISDLCQRGTDLEAHYTDFGLMPRDLAISNLSSRWFWSFHFLSGTWQIQAALFITAGIFALALMLGYRTRVATVVSWLFLVSLDVRNFHILAGGDFLLRVVLFWSMFLPWGSRFSIDSIRNDSDVQVPKQILSAGTVAFTIQIVVLYWFSVMSKSGREWWGEGSAVYYALSIDYVVTPFGHWLLSLPPKILKFATWSVLGYEAAGPLLLFSPWWTGTVRTLAVAGFILLHISILSTLLIGIFPFVAIASILFFLPTCFWDRPVCSKSLFFRARRLRWLKTLHESIDERADFSAPSAAIHGSHFRFQLSLAASLLAIMFMVYMVVWNIGNLSYSPFKLSDRARSIGNLVGLDQAWEMFAPFPAKDDGWYVIPAQLKNGRKIDLYTGHEIDWSKPKYIALTIKNHRWRKFFELLRQRSFLPAGYADYLCRDWNRRHSLDDSVEDLEIVFMVEWTRPNFAYFEPRALKLLHYQCPSRSGSLAQNK